MSSLVFLKVETQNTYIDRRKLNNQTQIVQLKAYLKKHEELYKNAFGNQPVEVVFAGKLLNDYDEIPEITSTSNSIEFYLKFLKETSKDPTEQFFTGRGWTLNELRNNNDFTLLLENMQDKQFKHTHNGVLDLVRKSYLTNESSRSFIIAFIIMYAFSKSERFKIENEFKINAEDNHNVIADHALYDVLGHPVLIIVDNTQQINSAIIQNLDQLRSFSMTPRGQNQNTFYGLVSNYKEWVFTCYIKPEQGKPVKKENFLISSVFNLQSELKIKTSMTIEKNGFFKLFQVDEPTETSTRKIIQLIRGFVKNLIGTRTKLIDKKGPAVLTEGGCKLLFEDHDWKIKLSEERDHILEKFKEEEVLIDVFSGSGALSVRAAKKGLSVYANEINSAVCDLFQENTQTNQVDKKVTLYNMNTKDFIRKILKIKKVDHIYMNQPHDAIEYLNEITQAFAQKSKISYSPEELPHVYIYGFHPQSEVEACKTDIVRRVQKTLKKRMKQALKADLWSVKVKIADNNLYCLDFILPLEIVQGEEDDEDSEFETYHKKIKRDI